MLQNAVSARLRPYTTVICTNEGLQIFLLSLQGGGGSFVILTFCNPGTEAVTERIGE